MHPPDPFQPNHLRLFAYLQKPNATLKELQAFLSEATLWATLRHVNILAFHGACLCPVPGKPICLVSEHMPGGDLFSALRATPERFRCVLGRGEKGEGCWQSQRLLYPVGS